MIKEETNPKGNQILNLNDFALQGLLRRGSFWKVFKIKEIETGKLYAAKVSMSKIESIWSEIFLNLMREVNIISKLIHPSILNFRGYSSIDFKKKPKPVIVSLEDLIQKERNNKLLLTLTQKIIIIYGIAIDMS